MVRSSSEKWEELKGFKACVGVRCECSTSEEVFERIGDEEEGMMVFQLG